MKIALFKDFVFMVFICSLSTFSKFQVFNVPCTEMTLTLCRFVRGVTGAVGGFTVSFEGLTKGRKSKVADSLLLRFISLLRSQDEPLYLDSAPLSPLSPNLLHFYEEK